MSVQEIAQKLVRQKEKDNPTIILLGAGASDTAGIPTTPDIINHVNSSPNFDHIQKLENIGYEELMGKLEPGERKILLSNVIQGAKINDTHFIVGLLMSLEFIDCVITTNFDPLIDNASSLFNVNCKVYDLANNVNLTGADIYLPSIIYLHGEYRNIWQLNTKDELRNADNIKSVISFLSSKQPSWIVVGYSGGGNDLVFEELTKIQVFERGLYWVGYKQENPLQQVQKELLSISTKNTNLIKGYTSDSFFKNLFEEIITCTSLDKFKLGYKLNTILLLEENDLEFGSRHQIQLTDQCRNWISNKATSLNSIDTKEPFEKNNSFTNLIEFISSLFSLRSKRIIQIRTNIRNQKYKEVLKLCDTEIAQNSKSPLGYFYKAVALGSIAKSQELPQERIDYFKRMNESFETAQAIADTVEDKPDEITRIDATKQTYFRLEYDRGVKLFQDDSVMQTVENPLEQSIAHFHNATIILPENADGWNALSITNARNQNFEKAAEAKNKFMSLAADTSIKAIDYMQLGSFYRSAEQPEKAVEAFEMGQEQFPENADLITNLASAYVAIGKPQQAITVFEQLISSNPENAEYRLTMGSELYNQAFNAQDSLKKNNQKISALEKEGGNEDQISSLKEENEKLQSRADTYLTRAEEELKTALENDPKNASAYEVLGIIHQFKAQMVFEELGRTPNNESEKAAALDKQGKQLLNDAMGYYEKAVEIDPEDQNYWKKLFQIYAALGMDKKAQEAMEKAEIN